MTDLWMEWCNATHRACFGCGKTFAVADMFMSLPLGPDSRDWCARCCPNLGWGGRAAAAVRRFARLYRQIVRRRQRHRA